MVSTASALFDARVVVCCADSFDRVGADRWLSTFRFHTTNLIVTEPSALFSLHLRTLSKNGCKKRAMTERGSTSGFTSHQIRRQWLSAHYRSLHSRNLAHVDARLHMNVMHTLLPLYLCVCVCMGIFMEPGRCIPFYPVDKPKGKETKTRRDETKQIKSNQINTK